MTTGTAAMKGAALRELVQWHAREHGGDAVLQAFARLDPRHQSVFQRDPDTLGVLASTWYPADAVHDLLSALAFTMSGPERARFGQAGGHAIMAKTLRGIYASLFRMMATPARYARYAPKLWATYYRGGDMRVELLSDGQARCTISDWPGHHPVLCEMNRAAAEVIFTTMGCTDVAVVRRRCVADRAPGCEFAIRWTPGTGA